MIEVVGHWARLRDDVAEDIVGVGGDDIALRVAVAGYIAVVVVEGDVELELGVGVGDREVEQAADASGALQRAGEVFAPEILYFGDLGHTFINHRYGFVDHVPADAKEIVAPCCLAAVFNVALDGFAEILILDSSHKTFFWFCSQ